MLLSQFSLNSVFNSLRKGHLEKRTPTLLGWCVQIIYCYNYLCYQTDWIYNAIILVWILCTSFCNNITEHVYTQLHFIFVSSPTNWSQDKRFRFYFILKSIYHWKKRKKKKHPANVTVSFFNLRRVSLSVSLSVERICWYSYLRHCSTKKKQLKTSSELVNVKKTGAGLFKQIIAWNEGLDIIFLWWFVWKRAIPFHRDVMV